jgi:hypothetical protein
MSDGGMTDAEMMEQNERGNISKVRIQFAELLNGIFTDRVADYSSQCQS